MPGAFRRHRAERQAGRGSWRAMPGEPIPARLTGRCMREVVTDLKSTPTLDLAMLSSVALRELRGLG